MDQRPEEIVVTGWGRAEAGCDPTPFLKVRKSRKYMGKQDELAVSAAGAALASAGLAGTALGPRAGLYMAVGHIAFERADIDLILNGSLTDGRVSMPRFAAEGYASANPLLTFRCLSNMPAYHVSVNFELRGPYYVGYPGAGQLYLALDEAVESLRRGRADVALVLGVADQRNFLVEHHFSRLPEPVPAAGLRDAAGCLVLETAERARARGAAPKARLSSWRVGYQPHDPFGQAPRASEHFEGMPSPEGHLGPGSLPFALSGAAAGRARHGVSARDGVSGESEWEVLA
jgi:3-oxoacyl-[acyl-carrier-protein] synthase II